MFESDEPGADSSQVENNESEASCAEAPKESSVKSDFAGRGGWDDTIMTLQNDTSHRLSPVQKFIIDKGYKINVEEGRCFSYRDFVARYKHGTLRNAFSKLIKKGLIYHLYRSNIAFYAVRGSGISSESSDKVTSNPMGDVRLLFRCLPIDDDSVHDIHLSLVASGLYEGLISVGWKPGEHNGDIALKPLEFPKGRIAKVRVHRTGQITVMVGCSRSPFPASEGLSELFIILDHLRDKLEHEYLDKPVRIPPIGSWKVVQWHHGVDGTREFSGPAFNFTYEDWSGHLIRFYAKKLSANRFRPRLERIESPKLPLSEIVSQLKSDAGGA